MVWSLKECGVQGSHRKTAPNSRILRNRRIG
jgi:hypothetical protein